MKIGVLVVEDDNAKGDAIEGAIRAIASAYDLRVDRAASVVAGMECLRNATYDLMVIDLHLPQDEGDDPSADGGRRMLQMLAMSRGGALRRPSHVLAITAFGESAKAERREFDGESWSIVEYGGDDGWRRVLGRKIIHIAESKAAREGGSFACDLCVITALHHVELEAVLKLPSEWRRVQQHGDATIYHESQWTTAHGKNLRVVAAAAPEMGMPATSALAMKMIALYRPRLVAMCGIAAGVKGEFGDILVATHVWDYGSGKVVGVPGGTKFAPAPSQIQLEPVWNAKARYFALDESVPRRISAGWGTGAARPPAVRLGPVASGAAVVARRDVIDSLVAMNRKLIGVDMEAYGIHCAAWQASEPRPGAIVIKSVCDFGDESKGDEYQRYAAYTSASYLYEFCCAELS